MEKCLLDSGNSHEQVTILFYGHRKYGERTATYHRGSRLGQYSPMVMGIENTGNEPLPTTEVADNILLCVDATLYSLVEDPILLQT